MECLLSKRLSGFRGKGLGGGGGGGGRVLDEEVI
jgi:hypothetical protein